MATLIIYDKEGTIISQKEGTVKEPVGVPFLWVDIPKGNYITKVNVSVSPNKAVFEQIPASQAEVMSSELERAHDRLNDMENMNIQVLLAMADVYETVLPFLP